jgi:hypothetical protein
MTFKVVRDLELIPRLCASIVRRKRIRPEDVRNLKHFCPRGLRLTCVEAEAVFALARADHRACPEWGDYFVNVMGCWFVGDYASERAPSEAASQLIEWLGGTEARLDPARFRMLARVLETIPDCPEELLVFARACLVRAMAKDTAPRARDAGAA